MGHQWNVAEIHGLPAKPLHVVFPGNVPAEAHGLPSEPLHAELPGNALAEVHGLPAAPLRAEFPGNVLAEVYGLPAEPLHAGPSGNPLPVVQDCPAESLDGGTVPASESGGASGPTELDLNDEEGEEEESEEGSSAPDRLLMDDVFDAVSDCWLEVTVLQDWMFDLGHGKAEVEWALSEWLLLGFVQLRGEGTNRRVRRC